MAVAPTPPREGPDGARRPGRILWDVLQEHLDEAAFLWRQREWDLASWEESLEEVAEGDEARLLAHVEGLVIGGAPVATRLLMPALEGEDEGADDTGEAAGAWRVPPQAGRVRVASVDEWWRKAKARFDERGRFVRGAAWSPAAVLSELARGPACLRSVWALELAVRTRGTCQVAMTARASHQLRQLQAAAALRLDPLPRGFDSLMTA